MVTAKLEHAQPLLVAGVAVLGLTLVGILVAILDPTLAGSARPHPTLTGSLGDWLSILADNARVLVAPFLLGLLGLPISRVGRGIGDGLVAVVIAVNAIPVGLELGRWRSQLLPYVPQLPFEWGALVVAARAWLAIRHDQATRQHLAVLAAVTVTLLLAAASLETWATPHRRPTTTASQPKINAVHQVSLSCGCPGVVFATDFAPDRPGRCKVARSLPLIPLGSARPNTGADRASSTTPGPPQGGTTT
jgi:hypothetical protein